MRWNGRTECGGRCRSFSVPLSWPRFRPTSPPSVRPSVRSSGGCRIALRGRRRRPRDRPRPLHLNARARPPHLEARAHFFGRARESSHDEHVCVSQLFEALSKRFISTKSLMWLPMSLYIPEGAELNKSLLTRDTSSTLPGSRSRLQSSCPSSVRLATTDMRWHTQKYVLK